MNDDDTITVPERLKMLAAALRPVAVRLVDAGNAGRRGAQGGNVGLLGL